MAKATGCGRCPFYRNRVPRPLDWHQVRWFCDYSGMFAKYGGVLQADSTYQCNRDGYHLWHVVITDCNGVGRSVFYSFIRNEPQECYDVAVEHFVRMMSPVNIVRTIVVECLGRLTPYAQERVSRNHKKSVELAHSTHSYLVFRDGNQKLSVVTLKCGVHSLTEFVTVGTDNTQLVCNPIRVPQMKGEPSWQPSYEAVSPLVSHYRVEVENCLKHYGLYGRNHRRELQPCLTVQNPVYVFGRSQESARKSLYAVEKLS
ncbi:hypothetical protein CLF_110855 [Clonorchis sinensis]|uniref:ZSWIM1/3 RNaseH-like domain-containing protein n=1 Tax=Clonorchis sinensis TaxID=79923 RepID=G7YTZ6_CLOSI|nr:hypothetical protein CLF_110855 [Clonorchis sinensis]